MLTKWEKIDDNKVKLDIEVAAPEVDTALARAYRIIVKKVNLPGFRKGKVPRRILESRFGPEILHEEALEILVPPAYRQAIEEAELEPIDQPQFDLESLEEGKPLLFSATVEVLPPVELGEYKGVEIEQQEIEITGTQVDQYLQSMREQQARLVPREEGPAEKGDLVQIDFKGFIDGEPFPEGEAENYSLELGSNTFIPGFEEQLEGAVIDEQREVKVKFPDDYRKENLAGKDALFQVTVKQIRQKQLPDLDDDFAKEVSEKDTLEELKAEVKERLEKTARNQAKAKLEEELIQKITENSKVEAPDTLVNRQIDHMLHDMEQYLRYQGLTLEKFAELSGKTLEELRADKRDEAIKRTRANLVLDAVIKKEGITVEESEVDERIAQIAASYNDDPARVKELFEKQGRLSSLREEIRIRKAIDLLVREAVVKTVPPETPQE
jgi:trigger factor